MEKGRQIPAKVGGQEIKISEENYQEKIRELEQQLAPGMLAYLVTYKKHSYINMGRPRFERSLFFSDGSIINSGYNRGKFGIQSGKRNHVNLKLSESGREFRIVQGLNHTQEGISIPKSHLSEHYNEGTFNISGGWTEMVSSGAGTTQIIAGPELAEQYPEAVGAMEFARDAIFFNFPTNYSVTHAIITEKQEMKFKNRQEQLIHEYRDKSNIVKNEIIAFALKQLEESLRKSDLAKYEAAKANGQKDLYKIPHCDRLEATQVSFYNAYHDGLVTDEGYLISPDDYVIQQTSRFRRIVGYIKPNVGAFTGYSYFLPSPEMSDVAESAFSEEQIKKNYPDLNTY